MKKDIDGVKSENGVEFKNELRIVLGFTNKMDMAARYYCPRGDVFDECGVGQDYGVYKLVKVVSMKAVENDVK